ncbi:45 kDa calcium-binding protein-like [Acanthaster planci]|uniref:45 kDa calcium-binding protein n=1 Tax=Acanthaster planci TaxID=133434 RepID=A0A8B7YF32_ACAPL|nr:45 kDa calcium-binding protein-like [Acanthaster planci]
MKVSICKQCLRFFLLIALLSVNTYDANVIRRLGKDKQEVGPNNRSGDPALNNLVPHDRRDRVRLMKEGQPSPNKVNGMDLAPPNHNDGVRLMRGGELNKEYKQEVFLGPDHADFENIPEREGKRRLMEIFSKADSNKDEYLDLQELTEWISLQTEKHFEEALEASKKIFPFVDTDSDGKIHWDEYRKQFLKQRGYGEATFEELKKETGALKGQDEEDYLVYRDRWSRADEDDDDILNQEEFLAFLHPEHCKSMLNLLVDELLHDFDSDGDAKLTLAEFVSLPQLSSQELEKAAQEDEWVRERIKEFRENMDLNRDGVCDAKELEVYVNPRNRQHAEGEASHLIGVADENGDDKLSPREVLSNYYVFVGSKLYNYGRNVHDEF